MGLLGTIILIFLIIHLKIPDSERDYYLERRYPSYGNLSPRDISSRAAKERIDAGFGIGPLKNAVYLDFAKAISHDAAEGAFDAAACIGCGACVATCKNSSAALFTSAKISHFALLPQGKIEARQRVKRMVEQMDRENFGHCSNTEACEVECPQQITVLHIARMNWEYNRAHFE